MMADADAVIAATIGTAVASALLNTGRAIQFVLSFDCSKMNVPAVPVETTWTEAER